MDVRAAGAYNLPCARFHGRGLHTRMRPTLPRILAAAMALAVVATSVSPALAALCSPPEAGAHPCCPVRSDCAQAAGTRLSRCCEMSPDGAPAAPAGERALRAPAGGAFAGVPAARLPHDVDSTTALSAALSGSGQHSDRSSPLDLPLRL